LIIEDRSDWTEPIQSESYCGCHHLIYQGKCFCTCRTKL